MNSSKPAAQPNQHIQSSTPKNSLYQRDPFKFVVVVALIGIFVPILINLVLFGIPALIAFIFAFPDIACGTSGELCNVGSLNLGSLLALGENRAFAKVVSVINFLIGATALVTAIRVTMRRIQPSASEKHRIISWLLIVVLGLQVIGSLSKLG